MKRLVFLIILCGLQFNGSSQVKSVSHQNIYWLRYFNQAALTKKLAWYNEFDNRKFFGSNAQHQYIMHSRLFYQLPKNTEIGGGLTYSRQVATANLVVPEFRLNQLISWSIPTTRRLTVGHRIWIEERFLRHSNASELVDGHDFSMRYRYRLQGSWLLSKATNNLKTTMRVSNEVMINMGKKIVYNYFDQNRLSVSVDQNINKNFSIEAQYFKIFQERAAGNQYFNRNILRLTLLHRIKLYH